jgi:hypothetical protein
MHFYPLAKANGNEHGGLKKMIKYSLPSHLWGGLKR